MNESTMQHVQHTLKDILVSIYVYHANEDISVLILKNIDFGLLTEVKKSLKKEKIIIFTEDDIKNGTDVFPLKFLHIKHHSELLMGTDALKDIYIAINDLRRDLESLLRNVLIDIREGFLVIGDQKDLYQGLDAMMEIIWEGMLYLKNITIPKEKKEKIALINDIWNCNSDIFLYLNDKQYLSTCSQEGIIKKVHDYLEKLCKKIDDFIQ